jgi:5-(carboxyamino)imidazole ribonucleotide mutase
LPFVDCRFKIDCGEAILALRPAGILPAVWIKGKMPSPRRKSQTPIYHCNLIRRERNMVSEKASVAVVMGSDSDMKVMKSCIEQLVDFGIEPVVRIISAHRTPEIAADFAQNAAGNGIKVIIAAAGMAAHLAGAMAAKATLPVIGVPLDSGDGLNGMDALLSTVQMPPGVPVATMAIGKAGAKNAAIFAVQILALSDKNLLEKLTAFKHEQKQKVIQKDADLH